MTRNRIALTTLAISLATAALVASASARELDGELRRDSAEAAFGSEGEQAPAPPTPVMTERSAGNGPLDSQSSSWGDGVYKSADGGRTWKNMGLATVAESCSAVDMEVIKGFNDQAIKVHNLPSAVFQDYTQFRSLSHTHSTAAHTWDHKGTNGFTSKWSAGSK